MSAKSKTPAKPPRADSPKPARTIATEGEAPQSVLRAPINDNSRAGGKPASRAKAPQNDAARPHASTGTAAAPVRTKASPKGLAAAGPRPAAKLTSAAAAAPVKAAPATKAARASKAAPAKKPTPAVKAPGTIKAAPAAKPAAPESAAPKIAAPKSAAPKSAAPLTAAAPLTTPAKPTDRPRRPAGPAPSGDVSAASLPGTPPRPLPETAGGQPAGEPPAQAAARPRAQAAAPGAAPQTDGPALPDFEAMARNMAALMGESSKVAAAYLKGRDGSELTQPISGEAKDLVQTLGQVAGYWLADPVRMVQAQAALSTQVIDFWSGALRAFAAPAEPKPEAKVDDKRFAAKEWREIPIFDLLRQAYVKGTDWANAMVESAEGLDETTREKARFYLRQVAGALSPSNFLATNPELLRETFEQGGENLVRGMRMLAEDIEAGKGQLRIRQADASPFQLGVNMAATPGKVILRNDLMELIQYAPATESVFKRPLLIVPPWINKFYVLDLNPEKSFIRWAVSQGLTVFVISWVNPDERHADKDFEAYMREGVFAALDAIEQAIGEREVTAIGYCVGGTLLAISLAYLAARGEQRFTSATLFTAQTDFRLAGDLKVFASSDHIEVLEADMREKGYLEGAKMANAFNMLRPNELIWSYVVNNYLRGKPPLAFDLLAWNADSTRMPAANHAFYLRNCYLGNKLTTGQMDIGGVKLDLGKVKIPVYNLATREDHIAPAKSVYIGASFFGGPVRYVLAGSGHIAGVVNPPAKAKYQYWEGPPVQGSFEQWLAAATEHPGSWWPDWMAWIAAQAPERVAPRIPGAGGLPALGDAPGEYVRVKS